MGLELLLLCATAGASVAAKPPPHVIVTMVDDLGWNGLGFNSFADSPTKGNNTEVQTPYIDGLAKGGVVLDNFYVYKFCSPTRASFLVRPSLAATSLLGPYITAPSVPCFVFLLRRGGCQGTAFS
eukprot:SAG31_NODE_128_length_23532_cov_21.204754_3_plen_125_part_00